MKKLLFSILTIPLFFSCSTVTKITNSDTNQMAAHESGIVMRPLLADLDVTQSRKSIEYIVPYYMNAKKEGKENALLQFKKTHKCDYVVDPVFEIVIETGNKNETKIIVNGYAASYSNIRQVDTLPESVVQYGLLPKNVQSLDYLNTIGKKDPTTGVEATFLTYTGLQFDKLLNNSKNRFYISYESNAIMGQGNQRITYNFIDKSNDSLMASFSGNARSYNTISTGLMREFPLTDWLKFRLQGGLNLAFGKHLPNDSPFSGNITPEEGGNLSYLEYNSLNEEFLFGSLGARIGGGIDIRIYKSLSFVAKVHYNLNLLKFSGRDKAAVFEKYTGGIYETIEDWGIKKMRFENNADLPLNLSVGLRIVF